MSGIEGKQNVHSENNDRISQANISYTQPKNKDENLFHRINKVLDRSLKFAKKKFSNTKIKVTNHKQLLKNRVHEDIKKIKRELRSFRSNFLDIVNKSQDIVATAIIAEDDKVSQQFDNAFSETKISKNRSDEFKLYRLFEIDLIPDFPAEGVNTNKGFISADQLKSFYQNVNSEKKELVNGLVQPKLVDKVILQAKKYPVMNVALKSIKENFDKWDTVSFEKDDLLADKLKDDIKVQLKNLEDFSDILGDLEDLLGDSNALEQITLDTFTIRNAGVGEDSTNLKDFLISYMNGTHRYHTFSKIIIKDIFQQFTENLEQESPRLRVTNQFRSPQKRLFTKLKQIRSSETTKKDKLIGFYNVFKEFFQNRKMSNLTYLGKKNPVSTKAIEKQAQLHQAIRTGKEWAKGEVLMTQGKSVNEVYELQNPKSESKELKNVQKEGRVAAFLKVGAGQEKAAGAMEQLMWDMAVVMGFEDRFVPTGQTEVVSKISHSESGKEVKRGGIQPAQDGKLLTELFKDKQLDKVPFQEVAYATLATIVFGMFDAHGGNILVNNEGKVLFFDNTRSMPNSNGVVDCGPRGLKSSYRNTLLDLPQAHRKMSTAEVKALRKEVAEYKQKFTSLKEYLETSHARSLLGMLPVGWMDLRNSLSATEERINLLEEALNSKVSTLRELTEKSVPNYRFIQAVTFAETISDKNNKELFSSNDLKILESRLHGRVRLDKLETLFTLLSKRGYDIKKIQGLAENPKLSQEDIHKTILKMRSERNTSSVTQQEFKQLLESNTSILVNLGENASYDFKDVNRTLCEYFFYSSRTDADFKKRGVEIKITSDSEFESTVQKVCIPKISNTWIVNETENEIEHCLLYLTPNGPRLNFFQLSEKNDTVKLDGQQIALDDFIKKIQNAPAVPDFKELPKLSDEMRELLVEDMENKLLFSKSEDGQSLAVTYKIESQIYQETYSVGKDGKFSGQSMKEIYEACLKYT